VAIGAVAVLAIGAAGCGKSKSTSGGGGGTSAKGKTIALLLPESKTARYETKDRPYFEAKFKSYCSDCKILYFNANQDAAQQQSQADQAITNGAKLLVLDPVDGDAAGSIVQKAKSQNIPVISYDRLIKGGSTPDYYVSFDNERVGQLQGQALLDALKSGGDAKRGPIVMINGSPQDNNAKLFSKGAHSVLDGKVVIGAEYDTPDWSPDKAQSWMESQLTLLKSGVVGVYAANDGTAGGAIAAMKGGGVNPLPPITGQDAELTGLQRILAGDQAMTVYKAIKPEAEDAAQAALALAAGKKPDAKTTYQNVPSTLLVPVAVTKDNIKDTVLKDGVYQVSELCTGDYAKACTAAGIS
jgi:D-xylose transport system substrate-binding protein